MISLFRKEIIQFFGSVTGTMVSIVFLSFAGLFLWVLPGNYNIPDGGYATLGPLFEIAPWIYLFLVPAITMRMFADERRSGTLDLLLSRPVSELQLVFSKFLAALSVVGLTLIPTLLWFGTIYWLGSPIGSIDTGATWGSYTGLFFLAVIYLTIGLLSSSLTDNQVIAFVLSVFLCFFWYTGFDYLADLIGIVAYGESIRWLGIAVHYESVSRGVLDSRDLLYFVGMGCFFVLLTRIVLEWKRRSVKRSIVHLIAFCVVLFVSAQFMAKHFFRIDFTSEKRYTLSSQTKRILAGIDSSIDAELLLSGELPSGFVNLQKRTIETLRDFNVYASKHLTIHETDLFSLIKPGTDRNKFIESLSRQGIQPINLRIKQTQGISTKTIFPTLVLRSAERQIVVNLLKNDPFLREEENLTRSEELLEYEISRAIAVLFVKKRDRIAFLTGQEEAEAIQVKDIAESLTESYDVVRINANQLAVDRDSLKALIIANPVKPFTEQDKYHIDQYLMNGGRIVWLIDPVRVSLDSLSTGMATLGFPRDLNLSDQLFRYGVRFNNDLIQDVDCQQIKVNTALSGQTPRYALAPWYFSPLLIPSQDHAIGKNVNRVLSEFVSSLDLVGDSSLNRASVILSSSNHARINQTPMMVSLRMIDAPPAQQLFNRQMIPVAVLREGIFESVFKNRIVGSLANPGSGNPPFKEKSSPTKQIFISDGGMIVNKITMVGGKAEALPLGYDRLSNMTFGNKEFLLNAVRYLCDDDGLIKLRSRSMQLRLLDKVKLRENKWPIQIFNPGIPIVLVLLGGLIFGGCRRRNFRSRPFPPNGDCE